MLRCSAYMPGRRLSVRSVRRDESPVAILRGPVTIDLMQALTSPVFRSIALGGLLLAATVATVKPKAETHRLVLHAPRQCGAFYLTAFRHGEALVPIADDQATLTFRMRADLNDGCRWQATETLVPISAKRYSYRYEERLLSCEPDALPYVKTPRTGYVDVVD